MPLIERVEGGDLSPIFPLHKRLPFGFSPWPISSPGKSISEKALEAFNFPQACLRP